MSDTHPTLCALCSKPLLRSTGIVWKAAPGVWTHMNSRCYASFSFEAHDALLPDCHEDHDLMDHIGTMCYGGTEAAL